LLCTNDHDNGFTTIFCIFRTPTGIPVCYGKAPVTAKGSVRVVTRHQSPYTQITAQHTSHSGQRNSVSYGDKKIHCGHKLFILFFELTIFAFTGTIK